MNKKTKTTATTVTAAILTVDLFMGAAVVLSLLPARQAEALEPREVVKAVKETSEQIEKLSEESSEEPDDPGELLLKMLVSARESAAEARAVACALAPRC